MENLLGPAGQKWTRGVSLGENMSSPFPLQWQTAKPTACKPETLGTTGHLLQRHEGGSGRCESGFAHSLQLGHSRFLLWNFDHIYEAQESYKVEYFWFWESWIWVVLLLKSANNHFQFLAFHIGLKWVLGIPVISAVYENLCPCKSDTAVDPSWVGLDLAFCSGTCPGF